MIVVATVTVSLLLWALLAAFAPDARKIKIANHFNAR
jgi:hypothetical protein